MPEDPKGYSGSESFQTKDLDNSLSTFEIREDGSIWEEKVEREWVEKDPTAKNYWDRGGYSKAISREWKRLSITDTLTLCDYQTTDGDNDYWIEYKICLKDGLVSHSELLSFSATSNADRKASSEKLEQEMTDWYNYKKTFKYRFFFGPWNSLISFIFRKISKLLNFLLCNCYRVEKFFKF